MGRVHMDHHKYGTLFFILMACLVVLSPEITSIKKTIMGLSTLWSPVDGM